MEILLSLIIAFLTGAGVFLILQVRTYPVVLGLTMLAYSVNLFLFAMGRLNMNMAPILQESISSYTDPLPQALVLTAIVISFGMTAFVIVLSLKAQGEFDNDHVDGASSTTKRIDK